MRDDLSYDPFVTIRHILRMIDMAQAQVTASDRSLTVTSLEYQWLLQALKTQRGVLARARQREMPGSDIDQLRVKEIASLDVLINKLGG